MSDQSLSAVVEKPRTQAAIGALRAEGVYDDSRSVEQYGPETVAIPITEPPAETTVREVVAATGNRRTQTLADHLREAGWNQSEIDRAPGSWAVIGSVILVTLGDTPRPEEIGEALLAMHGAADTVCARNGIEGEFRQPSLDVIAGEGDTETVHREHGTEYAMDLSEVMFSPGNKAERARMGDRVSTDEQVLDMFAGIGYFTLPMARAGAHVTAIERNPDSFSYLIENVVRNAVQHSVETYRADCRTVIENGTGTFDRVVMGYYDAYEYLDSALSALAPGGTLHMHEATPDPLVPDRPVDRLRAATDRHDRSLDLLGTRRVKSYSEGVSHVVVDAVIE